MGGSRIYVGDLERMGTFYEGCFGLTLADPEGNVVQLIQPR